MKPPELKSIPQSMIEAFQKTCSFNKQECAQAIEAILKELSNSGIGTRREYELGVLQSFHTPSRPGSPLVCTENNDIAPGCVIRVWHDMLNQWATGWLEVLFVIDDQIAMRDAAGGYTTRAISDTAGLAWRHPDFGPARIDANSVAQQGQSTQSVTKNPSLTMGIRQVEPKEGRWGRCKDCGAYVELTDAKEVVWDWDGVYAHAYYCKKCHDPNSIYIGTLVGSDKEHIIDQIRD